MIKIQSSGKDHSGKRCGNCSGYQLIFFTFRPHFTSEVRKIRNILKPKNYQENIFFYKNIKTKIQNSWDWRHVLSDDQKMCFPQSHLIKQLILGANYQQCICYTLYGSTDHET